MFKKAIALVLMLVLLCSLAGCGDNKPKGCFYSLEEAYEQGWISKDDLKKMAYIHYGDTLVDGIRTRFIENPFSDFIPTSKNPTALSAADEEKIKEAYIAELRKLPGYSEATADQVSIYGYCGTYNGYATVMITDSYHTYNGRINDQDNGGLPHFITLNVMPADISAIGIYVWKDGEPDEFCDLVTAWDDALFSEEELNNMRYYQAENYVESWSVNFTPATKTPKELSARTEKKIKLTQLDLIRETRPNATMENVNIGFYLGTFNGYVVLSTGGWFMSTEIVIGDVIFMFGSIGFLKVWKGS